VIQRTRTGKAVNTLLCALGFLLLLAVSAHETPTSVTARPAEPAPAATAPRTPAAESGSRRLVTGTAAKHDVSPPLPARTGLPPTLPAPAPPPLRAKAGRLSIPTPSQSFDGLGNLDNWALPDANGDVGLNYYIGSSWALSLGSEL